MTSHKWEQIWSDSYIMVITGHYNWIDALSRNWMKAVSGINIVLRNLSDDLYMRLGLQNHHYELPEDSSNVWTASMFPCTQYNFVMGSFSVFKVVKLSLS